MEDLVLDITWEELEEQIRWHLDPSGYNEAQVFTILVGAHEGRPPFFRMEFSRAGVRGLGIIEAEPLAFRRIRVRPSPKMKKSPENKALIRELWGELKPRDKAGRPPLSRKEIIERIAYALWAEEFRREDPGAKFPEIIREIGWPVGGTDGSKVSLLRDARYRLVRLKEDDPEGVLEEARARYQELKQKAKIMQ